MTTLYHNPRCSKSRTALKLLQDHGADFEVVEYLKHPLNLGELKELSQLLGLSARGFMRSGEAEYQALGLDQNDVTEADLLAAMHTHPQLMQRPILRTEHAATIGRPPENILALL